MAKFDLPEDIQNYNEDGTGGITGTTKEFLKGAADAVLNLDIDQITDDYQNAKNNTEKMKVIDKAAKDANDYTKSISDVLVKSNQLDTRSIFARARNSLLQFPVYISQSIRVSEASAISKMLERIYATQIQAALALNPIVNENQINNLNFIKNFHTNLTESTNTLPFNEYYQPIDETDSMMQEAVYHTEKITNNITLECRKINITDADMIAENTRLVQDPLSGFPYLTEAATANTPNNTNTPKNSSQVARDKGQKARDSYGDDLAIGNDEYVQIQKTTQEVVMSDNDIKQVAISRADISHEDERLVDMSDEQIRKNPPGIDADEMRAYNATKQQIDAAATAAANKVANKDSDPDDWNNEFNRIQTKFMNTHHKVEDIINQTIQDKRDAAQRIDYAIDAFKREVKSGKAKNYTYKNGQIIHQISKTQRSNAKLPKEPIKNRPAQSYNAVDLPKFLKDNEIKKINGAAPFGMEATFRIKLPDGSMDRDVKFILNIKTVLHLINPKDLGDDLPELVTGKIKSLQKVRYKTGEISWMDYMFNLSGLKKDAAKGIQYSKRWINTLKRLGEYTKMHGSLLDKPTKFLTGGNTPIPNASLVLSAADVATLTAETGIDLSSVSNAKRLAKSLFLITVTIVDMSAGTFKILYVDNASDWEIQSIAAISEDIAKTDNSPIMKELNRLVNK